MREIYLQLILCVKMIIEVNTKINLIIQLLSGVLKRNFDMVDENNKIFSSRLWLELKQAGFERDVDVVDFLHHHMGYGIILPDDLEVDFFQVLSELKKSTHWPDGSNYEDVTIRDLPVSEVCRLALARYGITTIEVVIQMIEYALITGLRAFLTPGRWFKYIDEIILGLQMMDCWPLCDKN